MEIEGFKLRRKNQVWRTRSRPPAAVRTSLAHGSSLSFPLLFSSLLLLLSPLSPRSKKIKTHPPWVNQVPAGAHGVPMGAVTLREGGSRFELD